MTYIDHITEGYQDYLDELELRREMAMTPEQEQMAIRQLAIEEIADRSGRISGDDFEDLDRLIAHRLGMTYDEYMEDDDVSW